MLLYCILILVKVEHIMLYTLYTIYVHVHYTVIQFVVHRIEDIS